MKRTDIINRVIKKIGAKKYLEIGVDNGQNFESIVCNYKVGVDPDTSYPVTFKLTSDNFFNINTETFDVIFVDGLHHAEQVYRDIINSLKILNEGGYIICHDLNPPTEEHQVIPYRGGDWNGDCWKSFVQLRKERNDLSMFTVNTDYGCGVITKGQQDVLCFNEPLEYQYFDANRKEWLNLISPEEFLIKFDYENTKESSEELIKLLHNYIQDYENAENNFKLGLYYHNIGQTASALSYYLRTAERTDDDLLKYECMILGSMCFDSQGTRNFTVKGLLQHAISILPKRPEAYYLLSRFYEREQTDGHWNQSYMIASIGEKVCDLYSEPLRTDVDYPGYYGILYQKALASWWCGLCDESRDLFLDLYENYQLDSIHRRNVIDNLKRLNAWKEKEKFAVYTKQKYSSLKKKFLGSEDIERNYSEAYQDMFVLTMLEGKRNGTYLEIGAGNSYYGNNTALLEQDFDWKGVGIDLSEEFVNAHNNERKNPCLLRDALTINYTSLLSGMDFPNEIDYLQLDCDPPEVTYRILLNIPFEKYKFAVITYEHDYYCDQTKSFQEKSRKYLESYGYVRVVNNISPDEYRPYEDWWVHPDLVSASLISEMMLINNDIKKAENYMLLNKNETIQIIVSEEFDWGIFKENQWMYDSIKKEFEGDVNYEKFFTVNENDVVVDIGASVGPFTKSIIERNPQKVICLEPHPKLYETLFKNMNSYENVICVNKGISSNDGEVLFENLFNDELDSNYVGDSLWRKSEKGFGITFQTLINDYHLTQIDFLKTDCEGGEYDIFIQDNLEWIKNNVKKIAGEWHLHTDELRKKFKEFRDLYLTKFQDFKVFFVDYHSNFFDITNEVWSDDFVSKYGWINIYINNQ